MMPIIQAITAALNAYCAWVRWQISNKLYDLEDELENYPSNSPANVAHCELLKQRIERERQRIGPL